MKDTHKKRIDITIDEEIIHTLRERKINVSKLANKLFKDYLGLSEPKPRDKLRQELVDSQASNPKLSPVFNKPKQDDTSLQTPKPTANTPNLKPDNPNKAFDYMSDKRVY